MTDRSITPPPGGPSTNEVIRVRVSALGGCGQFGMNALCIEAGDEMVVVDCGGMLPGEDMPGVDLVLPDLTYLEVNRHRVLAYLLTHGHEDHIAALPYALDRARAPVYGGRFTRGLVRHRIAEHDPKSRVDFRLFETGRKTRLGRYLSFEPVPVVHSIPDSFALAVHTPAGTVLVSGDFKMTGTGIGFDGETDKERLSAIGEEGVELLLSDSTNAMVSGAARSEEDAARALTDVFATSPGRVFVSLFASNVARIQTICRLCERFGRQVAFDGRSLQAVTGLARDQNLLQVPGHLPVAVEQVRGLPGRHVAVVLTGSQGEPRSALSRLGFREHAHLSLEQGDTVVLSARKIPGRERSVSRMVDRLSRLGAVVIDADTNPMIHASGHGHRDDLLEMIQLVRPRAFLPVHGMYRMQLEHAGIARQCGIDRVLIPDNGTLVELGRDGAAAVGNIPVGQVLVEGKGVGDVELPVLRDRRALAHAGLLVAVIVMDSERGHLSRPPELISRGFILGEEEKALMDAACREIESELAAMGAGTRSEPEEVADAVRRRLRRFFRRELNRTPVVIPLVIEM